MEDATDADLVRCIAARAEDARDAEAALCRRFAPRVRLYGLRHLRSDERAAELVQAVLLAVLEAVRAGRVEDPERIDRFVLGTCRNLALREHAQGRRAIPTDHPDLDVVAVEPELDRLDAGALYGCLAALDARARTILFLTFHAELPPDRIASAVDTTLGNVRVLRHRALAQLRACLEGGPS